MPADKESMDLRSRKHGGGVMKEVGDDEEESVLHKLKDNVEDMLLNFDFLDAWQKDNYYIITNYRRTSYSYWKSLVSIMAIHNETVNIWTHLVPGVLASTILLILGPIMVSN
jgi:hypothetical protein